MKRYKVICPLVNLQLLYTAIKNTNLSREEVTQLLMKREEEVVEGIDLFSGVRIRRVSKQDLEDLGKTLLPLPPNASLSPNMYVLEKRIIVQDDLQFKTDDVMRSLILALRLLKKGYVSGGSIFYIRISEKDRPFSSVEWSWDETAPLHLHRIGKYVLDIDEIPSVKRIAQQIQDIDFGERKSLRLACRRFQRVYEESDLENMLIDLVIAFEVLFLKGEKGAPPIGEKISTACARLLGQGEEEKEHIRNVVRKAYTIRNHIVHALEYEKKYFNDTYTMLTLVSELEKYLREAIKKRLT